MPKKGTVVWVRHDNQSLHWSYLPDGVSQPDIEKAFAESYDSENLLRFMAGTLRQGVSKLISLSPTLTEALLEIEGTIQKIHQIRD